MVTTISDIIYKLSTNDTNCADLILFPNLQMSFHQLVLNDEVLSYLLVLKISLFIYLLTLHSGQKLPSGNSNPHSGHFSIIPLPPLFYRPIRLYGPHSTI